MATFTLVVRDEHGIEFECGEASGGTTTEAGEALVDLLRAVTDDLTVQMQADPEE